MLDTTLITGIAGAGAVVGWLTRHFRNGTGQASEVVQLLRKIAENTEGQPDVFRELRDFMSAGRISMDKIDRLERREER